jgi:hypothetical protein
MLRRLFRTEVVETPTEMASAASFRLGLFGDTRSGKTMYLTALWELANSGQLPNGINLLPSPGYSTEHLNDRLARVRAGEWPPGDLDISPIELLLEYRGKLFRLRTQDFKGGDFGALAEPETKEKFETFIRNLFKNCSAYMFLLDPNIVDGSAGISEAAEHTRYREQLRATSSVEVALGVLSGTGKLGPLFHRPTAVALTKCDLHSDVARDPAEFARVQLPIIQKHLKSVAGRRHKYFALSSTGPVANVTKPPRPLKPENVLCPLLWCIDQHLARRRLLSRVVGAVGVIVALLAYGALFVTNGNRLNGIRSELGQHASPERLCKLFGDATAHARSSRFWLTHPFEREQVRKDVLAKARRRVDSDLNELLDANRKLRSGEDYEKAHRLVNAFEGCYSGTGDAIDLNVQLRDLKGSLAKRIAHELLDLAKDRAETTFKQKLAEYSLVATPEADKIKDEAIQKLGVGLVLSKLVGIFGERGSNPGGIDKLRQLCTDAEREIEKQRLPDTHVEVKYAQATRALYDPLTVNKGCLPLQVQINTTSGNPIQWKLWANKEGATLLSESDGFGPLLRDPINPGQYVATLRATVDVFSTAEIILRLDEDTYFGNGTAAHQWPLPLPFGKAQQITTNEGTAYNVTFIDPQGLLGQFFLSRANVEKFEDELFRKKR